MSSTPHMEFRLLEGADLELATALAAAQAGVDDPSGECWGLGPSGAAPLNCIPYGLMVKGGLAGVIWLFPHTQQNVAEVKALLLPRGRWGAGLMNWMLQNAAAEMTGRGMKGLFINLTTGGESLGAKLEEADFHGPQLADPGYPRGRWIKKI